MFVGAGAASLVFPLLLPSFTACSAATVGAFASEPVLDSPQPRDHLLLRLIEKAPSRSRCLRPFPGLSCLSLPSSPCPPPPDHRTVIRTSTKPTVEKRPADDAAAVLQQRGRLQVPERHGRAWLRGLHHCLMFVRCDAGVRIIRFIGWIFFRAYPWSVCCPVRTSRIPSNASSSKHWQMCDEVVLVRSIRSRLLCCIFTLAW